MVSQLARELRLGDILDKRCIIDGMKNHTKRQAIEELVNILWKADKLNNKSQALDRIMEREDLTTTALGDEVAIPHARLEVGEKPAIAIGRNPSGIDFDAPDGRAVKLIFVVLWAPEQPGLFNRLFGGLVAKLADEDFRAKLLSAAHADEIAKMLSNVRINLQAGVVTRCEADMLITLQLLEVKRRAGAKGVARQIELARSELPGSMLSRFDRLFDRYGEALAEAPDGVCLGCNMQLSSSFASEMLRNPDTVYICERCGRYLIHKIA